MVARTDPGDAIPRYTNCEGVENMIECFTCQAVTTGTKQSSGILYVGVCCWSMRLGACPTWPMRQSGSEDGGHSACPSTSVWRSLLSFRSSSHSVRMIPQHNEAQQHLPSSSHFIYMASISRLALLLFQRAFRRLQQPHTLHIHTHTHSYPQLRPAVV